MYSLNETHDPALRSWVASANRPGCDFPIQNLPFAIFRRAGGGEHFRGGCAIGDSILDLGALDMLSPLKGIAGSALVACTEPSLNRFMAMGPEAWSALRRGLCGLLRAGSPTAADLEGALIPQSSAEFAVPATIGDYTDFYASIHHATAVGRLFRPDNPLLPNYKWVPIAYHGRASSVRASPQCFARPVGQLGPPASGQGAAPAAPELAPTRRLDYELEVGAFIGTGNALGSRIACSRAEGHVFGLCLLNDWSARDVQAWEYQPLGPFLAKSFATTISPWVVTLEALAPFRSAWSRPQGDPRPLPYLDAGMLYEKGGIDIELEAFIETARMRSNGVAPHRLSHSNFRDCYWTLSQMVAHHTVNGCDLRTGDLLGSGTQSGPDPGQAGSLLELTAGGRQPITLSSGEKRTFLEDGDRVTFRGWCERVGHVRIGFGEVAGTVLPAIEPA